MSTFVSEDNRTLYDLNSTFYDAAKLTDPVKEYWESVRLFIFSSHYFFSIDSNRWARDGVDADAAC